MNSVKGFSLIDNNRKALLLFHGLTGSPFEMRYYGGRLHKTGYDVFCSCLPGHCTDINDLKSKRWQDWVSFGTAEFDKLKLSYDEVFIAGLCLGALVALSIPIENKNPKAIALLSPTLSLDGWSLPWFRFLTVLAHTPLRYFIDYSFKEREPFGVKNEHVRKKILTLLTKHSNTAYDSYPAVTFVELQRFSRYIRRNIEKVKAPAIIMHSELDDICNIKNAEFIYEHIGSVDKEFVRLKDSYHMITVDNDKDIVIEHTMEFFNCISSLTSNAFRSNRV